MESSKGEASEEMYSPDEHGEYAPEVATPKDMLHFSVQGLMDALMTEVLDVQLLPSVEFTLQLKVTMAVHPGYPHPPAFLFCPFCCQPPSPCGGVVPHSSGIRAMQALVAG